MTKILAFLRKSFLIESSYWLSFFLNIAGIFASLLSYFFIDRLFGHRIAPNLEKFGVNYFSYILVSIALFGYIGVGMNSFPNKIGDEQMEGTLEAILVTPTRVETILTGLGIWNFVIATIDIAIYALLGTFVFGVDLKAANFASAGAILFLAVLSFTGLGILSASFIVLFKRGNPVAWLVSALEGIVGGIFFPVSVLPAWLQLISAFFPVTYAVHAMELAVYRGHTIIQLKTDLAILAAFSIVLLPASVFLFKKAIESAKKSGTLASY